MRAYTSEELALKPEDCCFEDMGDKLSLAVDKVLLELYENQIKVEEE